MQALPQSSIVIETVNADNAPVAKEEPAGHVILEYCTVVRGILNDDQGGCSSARFADGGGFG